MSNTLKTTILLAALSAILLAVGGYFGGQNGLLIALGAAVVFNFGAYWFSDKMVLTMYRAREVDASHPLYAVVRRLATRARLPMPRVYVIPGEQPNAFATGRDPAHAAVAATEGILSVLDEDELEGVMAHELSHVRHRDILISSLAATVAAAIMFLSRFALFFGGGDRDRGNPLALIAMLILAPLAAGVVQAAISRSREFAADAGAKQLVGDPSGLVSALRKIEAVAHHVPLRRANPATAHLFIVKPFAGKGLLSLFGTHPPTEERIARLLGTA